MKIRSLLVLSLVLMVIAVSGCTTEPTPPENNSDNQSGNFTVILISDGSVLDYNDCLERGINNKVLVLHTHGCPACGVAVPILEELAEEIDYEFEFIELSTNKERAFELGIIPTHVPTTLIKCKAYTGAKTKEEFRSLIEG